MSYENVQTVQFGAPDSTPNQSMSPIQANIGNGVQTYQVQAPVTENLRNTAPIQQDANTVYTVGANGTTQTSGVQTVDTSQFAGGGESFLATARNNGFPAMGNLRGDTVVNFNGTQVELGVLEMMGEVVKTANGYELPSHKQRDANGNPQQQTQQQEVQQLPEGTEYFDSDIEASFAKDIEPVPQALYDAALAFAVENGIDGLNLNELAFQSGMTPEEARTRAENVFKAFSDQADNIAKDAGISEPKELWDWAMTEKKGELMNARRQLAFSRNTQAIRSLATEFFRSVPPTTEALERAGIPVRTDHKGETVALINGVWLTPAAAAKSGLI